MLDTILAHLCTLVSRTYFFRVVATRQTSSSGKIKSPRIQVVLPEDLCAQLADLAARESRTVSNMAKVLIQQGIQRFADSIGPEVVNPSIVATEKFRSALEAQKPQRLKGAPRRLRFYRPSSR